MAHDRDQIRHYTTEDIHHLNESVDRFNTNKAVDKRDGFHLMVFGFFGGGLLYMLSMNQRDHMAPVYQIAAFFVGFQLPVGIFKYLGAWLRRM